MQYRARIKLAIDNKQAAEPGKVQEKETEKKRDYLKNDHSYTVWSFDSLGTSAGSFNLRNRRGALIKDVPNIAARGGRPPEEGEKVLVGYYNSNYNDPFCIYPAVYTGSGPGSIEITKWASYRSDFGGDNAAGVSGVGLVSEHAIVDTRTPLLVRYDGANVWTLWASDGNSRITGPGELDEGIPGQPYEMIVTGAFAILFYEDGQQLTVSASGNVGNLEEIGPPVEVGPVVEYTPRRHPGRFCDDGGGIGVG